MRSLAQVTSFYITRLLTVSASYQAWLVDGLNWCSKFVTLTGQAQQRDSRRTAAGDEPDADFVIELRFAFSCHFDRSFVVGCTHSSPNRRRNKSAVLSICRRTPAICCFNRRVVERFLRKNNSTAGALFTNAPGGDQSSASMSGNSFAALP
jgi:hypothetical protein